MTDIFREVEEEVRRERYAQLWKKYGDYAIAGAALLIIGVAAFQLWRFHERREQAQASAKFQAAQQLLAQGQTDQATTAFDRLSQTAPGGYARVATLEKGNAMYAAGNVPGAVEVYKKVAAAGDPLLAPVARIRAAWASVDTSSRSDVAALLKPLLDPASSWNPMAQEVLAYADYRAGDMTRSLQEFQALEHNTRAPDAVRQRAAAMATYLGAGGDRNFGTVPPPPPQAPQSAPAEGQTPQ